MTFTIETPLSDIRSTINEASPIYKRRQWPTFSLHLDISRSFGATSSQLTTPALSPTQSCVLTPPFLDSPPSGPVTPTDTNWGLNEDDRNPTGSNLAFNFVSWANRDTHYFATPDFPSSSVKHVSAHTSTQFENEDFNVPCENHQLTLSLHSFPQTNPGEQNSISSVPQQGTGVGQPMSVGVKDDFATVAPRSRGPRDTLERVVPDRLGRELATTSRFNANLCSRFVVSANYRQLSACEMKEMKLGRRRHYKCLVDGCDRLFSRKSNVENHIRTHLDDKPFVCSPICLRAQGGSSSPRRNSSTQ